VSSLFGVGRERAEQLGRLGIATVEELLLHRPRRYEDRRRFRAIAELDLAAPAITRGTVVALGVKWFARHTKSIFELIVDDGTGRLHCRWWNLPFMEKYFQRGQEVVVFGKMAGLKPRTVDHPETEVVEPGEESGIHLNRITPVYPLTEGLPQRWLRALIWRTLAAAEPHIPEPWPGLDRRAAGDAHHGITAGMALPTRARAIRLLHFPESEAQAGLARQRLALDEFLELQLRIQARRRNFQAKAQALPCAGDNHLIKPFLAGLGFKLTEAQTRVLRGLRKNMSGPYPMRRLLQGDVGSGKTVVAGCCALMAIESGYDAALMAPTEVLAEQHFANFKRWLEPLGVPVALQTGSRSIGGQRSEGGGALTIGTHALLTAGFELPRLGLVIIDEQHRFGVAQREELVRKGPYPHLLVMTATPIPRTLGLTVYGELDVSTLDQRPPGRGRLRTFVRQADKLPKVWAFIREQLGKGRQAYVVYPRIEDSGAGGVKAVTQEFETVRQALAPHPVGLLHGRLKLKDKETVMGDFRSGALRALVATSLIEVGLDVPNATVMLIENAEQFGLAQLHQLRGRIGRGAHDAYCILLAAARGKEAHERLRVLEETSDGFRIAEADLQARGPGELLGQQQSGDAKFRFGDLSRDWDLVKQARDLAAQWAAAEARAEPPASSPHSARSPV
jgi:ATP-dependent DNA helicase RecG